MNAVGVHPQTGRGAVTINTCACHKGPGHAHTGAHVCTQGRSFQRGTVQHLGPERPREVGDGGGAGALVWDPEEGMEAETRSRGRGTTYLFTWVTYLL